MIFHFGLLAILRLATWIMMVPQPKIQILNMRRSGKNDFYWQLAFGKRSSSEEFFNVMVDPECIINLVEEEELIVLRLSMQTRMEKMLKEKEDPRMSGNGDIFNQHGFNKEKGWNYHERFMEGEFTVENTGWINPTDAENEPLD